MTQGEAIKLFNTEWWQGMADRDIVEVQLFEDRLLMPFPLFHGAVERVLGRPVFTHEFAGTKLQQEFLGDRPAPTPEQITALIEAALRERN